LVAPNASQASLPSSHKAACRKAGRTLPVWFASELNRRGLTEAPRQDPFNLMLAGFKRRFSVRQAKLARSSRCESGPGRTVARRPVASVAAREVTTAAKRTQQSCGVCIELRNASYRGGRDGWKRRRQHGRCRHARRRRSAGVADHITPERSASEPGRPPVARSRFGGCGPGRDARESVADPGGVRGRTAA